jgi:hypothetical protein
MLRIVGAVVIATPQISGLVKSSSAVAAYSSFVVVGHG